MNAWNYVVVTLSGSTLKGYRNHASGFTPLGKLIDWFYINSIGWRGIRVRKQHVERFLVRAIAELQINGLPVNIVDIAAGHGRYVLDSVKPHAASVGRILLRDYSRGDVEQGSALIAERGLRRITSFEQGDAFDRKSLAAIEPRPTVGVVSGLYELFPDNGALRESLDRFDSICFSAPVFFHLTRILFASRMNCVRRETRRGSQFLRAGLPELPSRKCTRGPALIGGGF